MKKNTKRTRTNDSLHIELSIRPTDADHDVGAFFKLDLKLGIGGHRNVSAST